MDPNARCRKCYATTRCCCNKNFTNIAGQNSPNAPIIKPQILQKPTNYPKSSVSVKHAHSREWFQSLYDTPCASVVSVDQILKPLRLAEREKWVPKYAFTSTTGLPLEGLLCECCSPRGCKCPYKCPTCGQKVDEELEVEQKKSTFEKPIRCIACRRCRLDEKCYRNFENISSTGHRPADCPPKDPPETAPKKTDCATQPSTSQMPDQRKPPPCNLQKPPSCSHQKTPPCSSTPQTSKCKNITMSENIIKLLLDKRDESFCSCRKTKSQTSDCKRRERFGAGSDNRNDTESEEMMTTNAIVSSTTEVLDSDSSCSVTIASDTGGKHPLRKPSKSMQKEKRVDKETISDEFKSLKKNYVVQDMWGMTTDLSANKIANISKSKKYISPQTGRVFNLNKVPKVPKVEISNQVIPKPLSVHDLLILNPRKSIRNNAEKFAKGVSGRTNKIINSEYISLRGGTDKKKTKPQKKPSEKFRFPNMNLLFSTSETPHKKTKANTIEVSGKSSELSNGSNQDDFLEKQVQEVLQKAKHKAGILAPLGCKLQTIEDMLKSSNLSKEILCASDLPQPRSTGGQDDRSDTPRKKSSERCEFSRFLNSENMPLAATLQQKILNFDDMVKSRLSSLILGRFPDLYETGAACSKSKRFRKEQGLSLPEFNLPYSGCASKCRTFDDIVKSKLSTLILGRIPEVKFECESSNCIACSKKSIGNGGGLLCSNTGLCKPLNIRRLPCTNIPRALMRFDDIIKAKLSSAILGAHITPESIMSNVCSSRDCTPHTQYLPTPRTVLLPTTVCTQRNCPGMPSSPSPSRCGSPMKLKPSVSPKNLPRVCTPCPSPRSCSPKSSVTPSCPSKSSKNWCPPKKTSSKTCSDCSPKSCSSRTSCQNPPKSNRNRDCSTPPMKSCSSRTCMPTCSSRQSTCSPNRVNFDMINVPCVPSVCDVGTGCEPRKKRTCSSFTSICTNRGDPCHDLGMSCQKPMCVRDFRGPELNFTLDCSRKRNRTVCKPCPTPCVPFFPCSPPCCSCDRCERPKSTCMSGCKNPYLDPNWTASSTEVRHCVSSGIDLCCSTSKFNTACCNRCNPCPLCKIRSPICDIPICAGSFKKICSHKDSCCFKAPKCGPCGGRSNCIRSAPCKPTCNPYMDCNWTGSPSMQCLGYDSRDDCRLCCKSSSRKCCTGARCNDRWCYYYSLGTTEDFIEYPPLPQNKFLTPEDFDYPIRRESDCSIDTLNSLLAINDFCPSSNSCTIEANSNSYYQMEESITASENTLIADNEQSDKFKELDVLSKPVEDIQQAEEAKTIPSPKSTKQEGDQEIHSFYKDTIISYCFIQEIPAFSPSADTNLSSESEATVCTSTTTETEDKISSYEDCSTTCVYQDDFVSETRVVDHNETDEKFAKAVEKICALAKASTTFKQTTMQSHFKLSGDVTQNPKAQLSMSVTKEIYNIQFGFSCSVKSGEEQKYIKHKSSSLKRKCVSLLSLRRKGHDTFQGENLNEKEPDKCFDDSVPYGKFMMKHSFPIIRGRVFPNYKPAPKSQKYLRLVRDIYEG